MNQPCRRQTAAGRFSGNLMTKVTVYFRTIRSGFNTEMEKGAGGSAPRAPPDPSHLIFIKRKEHAVFNSTLL